MVGGGIVSRRPAAVSREGRLLLAPCGRSVHIYSAATGERVGALSGHAGEVTCVLLNPENDTQAYTASLDGSVRLWDVASGACLRTIEVKEAVKAFVVHKGLGVAYLSIQMREGGGRVLLHNLVTGKYSGTAMKTRVAGPLVLSPTGSLCATFDRHSLFVWRTGADIYQPLNLQHTKPYTCLAISADDSVLAAGDASGRVLIWRSFDGHVPAVRREGAHAGKHHPSSPPPLTTLHWHAAPVGCLAFSPDGVYLLSGGAEGVLVMWALETNRPSFLPRLGGPLIGVHPSPADPARYLLRQADNCLRLVNLASLKVEASVHGLRPPPRGAPAAAAAAATALRPSGSGAGGAYGAGALVVPCDNATLQLYDVLRDRHVGLLRVAPRNAVSLPEQHQQASSASTSGAAGPLGLAAAPSSSGGAGGALAAQQQAQQPLVQHLAFSPDGSVMVTVDVRPDAGPFGGSEACLKFWDASTAASTSQTHSDPFLLNTRVDEPHRGGVAALAYHPARHMAVTTGGGGDAEFRLWVQAPARRRLPGSAGAGSNGGGSTAAPGGHWRCASLGSYRGLPLGAAAFSAEGSVLALGAGSRVTLWDPESLALAAVMAPPGGPASAEPVARLAFVPGTPFLVAATSGSLTVYNLLTAAPHWGQALGVLSLAVDPARPRFAIATPSSHAAPPAAAPGAGVQQPGAAEAGEAAAAPPPQALGGAGVRGREFLGARPGCTLLVFDPAQPAPKYYAHVPGAQHVHLMHVSAAAVAEAAGGGGAGADGAPSAATHPDASPLLVLKDNRQYTFAALQPAAGGAGAHAQAAGAAAAQLQGQGALLEAAAAQVSAFEAAFGPLASQPVAAADAADDAAAAALAAANGAAANGSGAPRWQGLFDVPSHALPPPSALAQAFLTLLTTA